MVSDVTSTQYQPQMSYRTPTIADGAANAYARNFVGSQMAINTLLTPGTIGQKIKSGTRGGVEAYVYLKAFKFLKKMQHKLYEKSPKYAEWANRNPLANSIISGIVLLPPAFAASIASGLGYNWIVGKLGGDKGLEKLDNSSAGQWANKKISTKFMKGARRALGWTLGIATIVVAGILAFTGIKDALKFKKEYKEAEQKNPNLNTYQLHNIAASDRLNDYLAAHPKQAAQYFQG